MRLFRSKKTDAKPEPQKMEEPRKIPIPDWKATEFDDIGPDQFKYFLEVSYKDPALHIGGRQLIALAFPVVEEFVKMQRKFKRYMTFGEWRTVLDNIINTGKSGILGDNEEVPMAYRSALFEVTNGLEMLSQQYDDMRSRSSMYFNQSPERSY